MPAPAKTLLAVALAFGLALPAAAAETPGADTVVATVGGQPITLGHMIVMTSQLPQEYQALPDDVLYEAVLDQLVKQTAVALSVENALSREAVLALENQRRSFLAGEALTAAAAVAVTDDAIATAYEKDYAGASPEPEFNASHILVATEEEAQAIKAELDAGADFATLAQEKSTGPSGPSGGALGWFSKGMMIAPFEAAVEALAVGEISGPVQTQFGWHIIRLDDRREAPVPELEEVRAEIVDKLQQAAVEAAIEELTANATVELSGDEIDPGLLRNTDLLNE